MLLVSLMQNVDTVMSETRLPIIGAVIMTLEAGRPTIVKEQVCMLHMLLSLRKHFCAGLSRLVSSVIVIVISGLHLYPPTS